MQKLPDVSKQLNEMGEKKRGYLIFPFQNCIIHNIPVFIYIW
jgi:hypothetical protein